jgi:chemotaxis protein CheX
MTDAITDPFIATTLKVLSKVAGIKATPGNREVKTDRHTWGPVTGIIDISSESIEGNLILSFEKSTILSIAQKMLHQEFTEINEDVLDAVGEITNMVLGGTKRSLREMGMKVSMALPCVVEGKNVEIIMLPYAPRISIPLKTEDGDFVLEIGLVPREKEDS